MSPANGRLNSFEIGGKLYALDRRLPFGERLNGLARFRGSRWPVTRWLTNTIAPLLADFAVWTWRARSDSVPAEDRPFVLSLTHESLREGLRLLIAEWMEFRRMVPGSKLDLVLRACPSDREQSAFESVTPYWEQVQGLKRQLGVNRARVYLWLREADAAGDERLLDAARALVVAARGQGFVDCVKLALRRGKPVIGPRAADLPHQYPFAFATRPAILRFTSEPRRLDTSSIPWPIPEEMELARALARFATADDATIAAAMKRARQPHTELVESAAS